MSNWVAWGLAATLALALLGRLGGSGNLVFSPYSVDRALAMVDQGAARATAAQIDRVLAASGANLASSHRALRTGLAADAPQMKSADALWLQAGLALERPCRLGNGNLKIPSSRFGNGKIGQHLSPLQTRKDLSSGRNRVTGSSKCHRPCSKRIIKATPVTTLVCE